MHFQIIVPGEDFDIQNVQSITIIKESGTFLEEPKTLIVSVDKVLWFSVTDSEGNLYIDKDGYYIYQVVRIDGSVYNFNFSFASSNVIIG